MLVSVSNAFHKRQQKKLPKSSFHIISSELCEGDKLTLLTIHVIAESILGKCHFLLGGGGFGNFSSFVKEVASKFLWPMEPPVSADLFLT